MNCKNLLFVSKIKIAAIVIVGVCKEANAASRANSAWVSIYCYTEGSTIY